MYPHRLTKLDEPDQEKPVANQDFADVIIEEIVHEQEDPGGSAFVACLSKLIPAVHIHLNVCCVVALPPTGPELAKSKYRSFWKRRNRIAKMKNSKENSLF